MIAERKLDVCAKTYPHAGAPKKEIAYRLARSKNELEQAFELVWNAYVRVGLEKSNGHGIRLTKYHLLPDAKVFVAIARSPGEQDKVIGTITVVPDGVFGVPAEEVADTEITGLRRHGKRFAEFVALAANEEGTRQRVVLKLARLASEYCRLNGYATILASLTERHIGFYRKFLSFQPLGELKPYKMGNGTPVQVHCIHLDSASSLLDRRAAALESDPNWSQFCQNEASTVLSEAERARPWDVELIRYFCRRSRDFAKQLNSHTKQALQSEYQRYGWSFRA